jgi:glycyl-tRNA synthetase beta chain
MQFSPARRSRYCFDRWPRGGAGTIDTEDENFLAGYKRANQYYPHRREEGRAIYSGQSDPSGIARMRNGASKAIKAAREDAAPAVAREDFEAAMRAIAKLRPHVDAFLTR